MRKLSVAIVTATTVFLAGNALADTAERCQALRAQADHALWSSKTEGSSTGKLERDIGVDLCRRGKYAEGARELEKAIRALGFQPN
ncbi:hypothetical protein [Desertibaculum subflavum]|uniref:hypothetical protein n=1 Tax=Desertibaculum subflavum TaxID=2268458 RepID=UPI000E664F35